MAGSIACFKNVFMPKLCVKFENTQSKLTGEKDQFNSRLYL